MAGGWALVAADGSAQSQDEAEVELAGSAASPAAVVAAPADSAPCASDLDSVRDGTAAAAEVVAAEAVVEVAADSSVRGTH